MIWAENISTGGACIIIRLPVMSAGTEADDNKLENNNNILIQNNDNAA